ncbi:MAG TPA: ParA family protein, partial [Stenomitos sp.]
MSRAIALFNQAGGVGKTTITQNLGYQLSARGHKVLLIDLD